jgi:hypothetical protein
MVLWIVFYEENGERAGIEYVHKQTRLAKEYMILLRADAEAHTAFGG